MLKQVAAYYKIKHFILKQRFSRDPILTVAVASKTLQEPKII
jgi:hypothetical protein